MWILKNIKNLTEYPKWLESSEYKSFAVSAEIANFSAEKKEQYDRIMNEKEYRKAVELTKYIVGKEEGFAQGVAEGKLESLFTVAKAMLSNGISADVVSTCTGLTLAQISAL